MTDWQCCVESAQRHFDRQCLRGRIEEAAIGRSFVGVGDRSVEVPLSGSVNERLASRSVGGSPEKETIASICDAKGIFISRA
jgi:hypothetical protein